MTFSIKLYITNMWTVPPTGWKAGWAAEPIWTRWWREILPSSLPRGVEPLSSRPYPSLCTDWATPTALCKSYVCKNEKIIFSCDIIFATYVSRRNVQSDIEFEDIWLPICYFIPSFHPSTTSKFEIHKIHLKFPYFSQTSQKKSGTDCPFCVHVPFKLWHSWFNKKIFQ
jgi:hypothetical protein